MITDSQFKTFKLFWPPICEHNYERVSRVKWRIQLDYKCGAQTIIENIADDFIQYLVLGAFNSRIDISSSVKDIPSDMQRPEQPIVTWKEFQPLILKE
ncbi:MAG: hypothetical protein ACI8W1_001597 [Candidatus Azotimanducaceae bacterium]|jgi:hypothetical protein|tara:strand:- start:4615 stop:4908 length:294 start_codon:yes stop_codon:yes gene_type:complete